MPNNKKTTGTASDLAGLLTLDGTFVPGSAGPPAPIDGAPQTAVGTATARSVSPAAAGASSAAAAAMSPPAPSAAATLPNLQVAAANPPPSQAPASVAGSSGSAVVSGGGAAAPASLAGVPTEAAPAAVAGDPMPAGANTGATGSGAVAGPVAAASAAAASPPLLLAFPGPTYTTNGTPKPDADIAVGLTNVITTENARIQWYDKNGNLQSDQRLFTFLNASNPTIADTHVVYDSFNNRFVLESLIVGSNQIELAVSKDGNPNDGWYFATINTNLTISGQSAYADFPGLATDGKVIYLTANMRAQTTGSLLETHLWIIQDGVGTGGFYSGGPLQVSDFSASTVTGGASTYFGWPTQMLTSPSGSLGTFLVRAGNTGVTVVTVQNPTTTPTFTYQFIPGPASGPYPNGASQPGTTVTIDDSSNGNAVWQNGMLYTVGGIAPTSGPDAGVATADWYRIDTRNLAGLTIADQGVVSGSALGGAGAGVATYNPSIAVDPNGDFLIDFNASGPNLYAGAYYAYHAASDAPGTIEAPQTLQAGVDYYATLYGNTAGWGDFSGAVVDPANGATFWLFNQYAAQRGSGQSGNWGTEVGAVGLPPQVPYPVQRPADFNGDGTADLVWRNTGTGDVSLWAFAPGAPSVSTQDLGIVGLNWMMETTADFGGNGRAGIAWRDTNTGDLQLWNGNPGSPVSFTSQDLGIVGLSWAVEGSADFTGNGHAGLLWRDTTGGDVQLWNGNPGSPVSFTSQDLGVVGLNLAIEGVADFTADGKAGILWRDANTGDVQLWAANPGTAVSFTPYDLGVLSADTVIEGVADFNGDGKADILLRNLSTGDVQLWASNPGSVSFTTQDLGIVTSDWAIRSAGDFDGNGRADILWQNVNGTVQAWYANTVPIAFSTEGIGPVGGQWNVAATGDFNADGMTDVLWRDTASGDVSLWNAGPAGGVTFTPQDLGPVSADWVIQGAADFTGGGSADILWRNATSGVVSLWESTPGSPAGFTAQNIGWAGTGWAIAAAADVTGDGRADILWRNTTNGDVSLWRSNPSGGVSFAPTDLGIVGADWTIVGAGDFSGDGSADILWRNTNGDISLWKSAPGSATFTTQDLGVVTPDWTIVGIGDFNGDGKADILWRNTSINDVSLWASTPGASVSFTFHDLGGVAPGLTARQVGDFNGSGRAGVLWQDTAGNVTLWNANSAPLSFTAATLGAVNPSWQL